MKVLMINGSPHEKGCTFTALSEVAASLLANGVDSHIHWIGTQPVSGCLGCGGCRGTRRCVVDDDVNLLIDQLDSYDGFVFGAPVHYASASGAVCSLLDRLFQAGGSLFANKPAGIVASARRAGTTAALDRLIKYPTISNMPVVSSTYWNMVHGSTPDDVRQDAEGMQIMRRLGANMAWLLHCIEAGKASGVALPQPEPRVFTNFIRD